MINPFRSAFEYAEWLDKNCCDCKKYQPDAAFDETECQIQRDISLTLIPFTHGVEESIYERMGRNSGNCKEKEG
mgnify:CR=1 FL=1